jgi:hypothetical protein
MAFLGNVQPAPPAMPVVFAGPSVPHLLVQQATSVLLAAVAALSLSNVAGGRDVSPAAMADLLRSPELRDQLDKRKCLQG